MSTDREPPNETLPLPLELALELLRRGRSVEVVVAGESMWPLVRAGARLRIDPRLTPARGQLGAFIEESRLVVHRIVGVEAEGCWLLGDLGGALCWVPSASLLGVVQMQERGETRRRLDVGPWRWLGYGVALLTPRTRAPWRWARRAKAWAGRRG